MQEHTKNNSQKHLKQTGALHPFLSVLLLCTEQSHRSLREPPAPPQAHARGGITAHCSCTSLRKPANKSPLPLRELQPAAEMTPSTWERDQNKRHLRLLAGTTFSMEGTNTHGLQSPLRQYQAAAGLRLGRADAAQPAGEVRHAQRRAGNRSAFMSAEQRSAPAHLQPASSNPGTERLQGQNSDQELELTRSLCAASCAASYRQDLAEGQELLRSMGRVLQHLLF